MARNCCKYFTVSLVPAASFILAVVFGLGIVTLPVLYAHLVDYYRYAIVIDAGSSHTDMYVYKWPVPKHTDTATIKQIHFCSTQLSLNSFNQTPSKADDLFKHSCFTSNEAFKKAIPSSQRKNTAIYMGATAGMRLVHRNDSNVSTEILSSANSWLKDHSGYEFMSGRIISGEEEATGGWATVNYLNKALKNSDQPLLGSLDMGGASTEIAFLYPKQKEVEEEDDPYSISVDLFGEQYHLYARSYLCYGQNEARWRFLAHLINITHNTTVHNPCMLSDSNITYSSQQIFSSICVKEDTSSEIFGFGIPPPTGLFGDDEFAANNTNYTFIGTGDPDHCSAMILDVFRVTNCSDPSVCIDSTYTWPPINNSHTFLGMSGFYYAADFFNNSNTDLHSLSDYNTTLHHFCKLNYSTAHQTQKDSHLLQQCFDGSFSLFLLQTAFGFNSSSNWTLKFQDKVKDWNIGWAMGYLLKQTQTIPNSPNQTVRPYTAVDLVVGIIILSILCVVFVIFFFLTFHACRKVLKTRGGYSTIP